MVQITGAYPCFAVDFAIFHSQRGSLLNCSTDRCTLDVAFLEERAAFFHVDHGRTIGAGLFQNDVFELDVFTAEP